MGKEEGQRQKSSPPTKMVGKTRLESIKVDIELHNVVLKIKGLKLFGLLVLTKSDLKNIKIDAETIVVISKGEKK